MLRTDHVTVVGNGLRTYGDLFWSVKACFDRQSALCHSMRNISYLQEYFGLVHTMIICFDIGHEVERRLSSIAQR